MGCVTALKQKGDMAELAIALDLRRRGYVVSIPFGESAPYDLVLDRGAGPLERVQVKHGRVRNGVVVIRCFSLTIASGKVRSVTPYTPDDVDWIAAWEPVSGRCFYVPSAELGVGGRTDMKLRIEPTRNGQRQGIRWAAEYESI